MSKFREKLEELFLKILESKTFPEKPTEDELYLMVAYAKISPEMPSPLEGLAMMKTLSEQMNTPFSNIKTLVIDEAIAQEIMRLNPDFVDKFKFIRDSEGKAIGLQIP